MKAFVVLAVVALAAAAPEPPTGGYKAPQQGGYDDAALSSLGSIDIAQLLAFARSQQRARASAAAPSANYGAPAAAAGPAARASAPASGYSAPSNAGGYSSSGRNPGGYSSSANQQQTQQSGGYSSSQQSQQSGGYSSSQQSQQSGGYSAPAAPAPAASSGYSAPAQSASSGYSAPAQSASSGYSAPAASSGYAAPAKSSSPASQYGAPDAGSCDQATGAGCNGNDGNNGNGNNGNNGQESSYEQKVHKHVYIHVAPEEPKEAKAPKAPKAPLVPEKHYKILFIRAPTPPPYEQPEIEDLPPAPEQKTLVYVLLKKPDATPAIQLSTPAPTKPSKPEVYFIRYKSPESQDANNAYGAPAGPVVDADAGSSSTDAAASPDAQYGAPARQNGY